MAQYDTVGPGDNYTKLRTMSNILLYLSLGLIIIAALMAVFQRLKLAGVRGKVGRNPEYQYFIKFFEKSGHLRSFYLETSEKVFEYVYNVTEEESYEISAWRIGRGPDLRFGFQIKDRSESPAVELEKVSLVVKDEHNNIIYSA